MVLDGLELLVQLALKRSEYDSEIRYGNTLNKRDTMKRTLDRLGGILLATAAVMIPVTGYTADHLDGPAASADPAADITDVFAWMQNSDRINMIINLFPLANTSSRFSDSVQYVFRVNSQPGYGQTSRKHEIRCTFSASQLVTCELDGRELVRDVDASGTAGVTNADGSFRIFAGLRNDPFYFDLDNFNIVRRAVRDAVPALTFDEAGCPTVDQGTKDVLVGTLVGNGGLPGAHNPPQNFFGALNVLSIVVQADRGLFGSGPLYSVSASTHRSL